MCSHVLYCYSILITYYIYDKYFDRFDVVNIFNIDRSIDLNQFEQTNGFIYYFMMMALKMEK